MKSVCVLVLGDLGRSPRMQYHCISLANKGFLVNFVGLKGSDCRDEVLKNNSIKIHEIKPLKQGQLPTLLYLLVKMFYLFIQLLLVLLNLKKMDYLLVQTPPAVPTLFVAQLVCWLRGCKLVIDWHNLGFSLIALTRKNYFLTETYKWMEFLSGRGAFHNFCVSAAMQQFLIEHGIRATVLCDKPPHFFKPSTKQEQQQLFAELASELKEFPFLNSRQGESISETLAQRKNLLIGLSSTSWTADEDFSIVLDALLQLEAKIDEMVQKNPQKPFRKLLLFITGKGEMKQLFLNKIREHNFKHVGVKTLWLEPFQYPILLGSCDFGICVHGSSSGLDLPMKVVDMFGSGLPVCALAYPCLNELVQHNRNGVVFSTNKELADSLFEFLSNPHGKLTDLQKQVITEYCSSNRNRWEENWKRVAGNVFI